MTSASWSSSVELQSSSFYAVHIIASFASSTKYIAQHSEQSQPIAHILSMACVLLPAGGRGEALPQLVLQNGGMWQLMVPTLRQSHPKEYSEQKAEEIFSSAAVFNQEEEAAC